MAQLEQLAQHHLVYPNDATVVAATEGIAEVLSVRPLLAVTVSPEALAIVLIVAFTAGACPVEAVLLIFLLRLPPLTSRRVPPATPAHRAPLILWSEGLATLF